MSIAEVTAAACETWNREPLFHISSPLAGWAGPKPERHHDEIDLADFPLAWLQPRLTVDVEAKAKEAAVLKLRDQLVSCGLRSADPVVAAGSRRTRSQTQVS